MAPPSRAGAASEEKYRHQVGFCIPSLGSFCGCLIVSLIFSFGTCIIRSLTRRLPLAPDGVTVRAFLTHFRGQFLFGILLKKGDLVYMILPPGRGWWVLRWGAVHHQLGGPGAASGRLHQTTAKPSLAASTRARGLGAGDVQGVPHCAGQKKGEYSNSCKTGWWGEEGE